MKKLFVIFILLFLNSNISLADFNKIKKIEKIGNLILKKTKFINGEIIKLDGGLSK